MKIEKCLALISRLKLEDNPKYEVQEVIYYLLISVLNFARKYPEIFNEEPTLQGCRNILLKNLESIEKENVDIIKNIYNNEKDMNDFTASYDPYMAKIHIFLSSFNDFNVTLPHYYAIEKLDIWLGIAGDE